MICELAEFRGTGSAAMQTTSVKKRKRDFPIFDDSSM